MDLNNLLSIQRLVRYAARKRFGITSGLDDLAQEVACRILEGRHQRSTIDQMVIDYLRSSQGQGEAKRKLLKALPLESVKKHPCRLSENRILSRLTLLSLSKTLTAREIEIILLYFAQGLSFREVGEIYRLSASRILRIIKSIRYR